MTVTHEGNSQDAVSKFDTVEVHYTGTFLDGEVFDSSVTRGQPLKFDVGRKRVIRCWDEGLVGLKVGSKAELVCPPHYAYGDRPKGKIPANSTLLFSVEVVSIVTKYQDPAQEAKKEDAPSKDSSEEVEFDLSKVDFSRYTLSAFEFGDMSGEDKISKPGDTVSVHYKG